MPPERRVSRERSVLAGLERFCAGQGLGAASLVADVIAAYLCGGLEGRAPSTKGTYHSVLRRLGGIDAANGAPRFSGSLAPAPYRGPERAELYAIASAQRRGWRVHSALALLALTLGAGLRPGELVGVKGRDVARRGDRVVVRVGGGHGRVVEVRAHEADLLDELARDRGAYVFHPHEAERSYPNFVNDFCRQLVADPAAARLSAAGGAQASSATTWARERRCACCSS